VFGAVICVVVVEQILLLGLLKFAAGTADGIIVVKFGVGTAVTAVRSLLLLPPPIDLEQSTIDRANDRGAARRIISI
jgi:hypothetical protein